MEFWRSGTPPLVGTTDLFVNTDTDDFFPNDDYFPDVNDIFDDMNTDGDNGSSSNTPYVLICVLLDIMLRTVFVAICVELLFAYSLELLFVYSLLDCMTSLIYVLLVIFYLLFLMIKSCENFLIYSTYVSVCVFTVFRIKRTFART